MSNTELQVTDYDRYSGNGRYIGKGSMVTFPDGQVVKFSEKMSKKEARRQAPWHIEGGTGPCGQA